MTKIKEYLQNLETVNLITLRKSEPELVYAFKHIFTQESIYNSLLNTDRRQLHQKVGKALEILLDSSASSGDSADDVVALLAYHFEKSGDKERALKYLKLAANQASAAFTNQEACELYSRAFALLDHDNYAHRWDLLADREQTLDRLGERESQANDLTLMQTLAELMEDDQRLVITHNRRAAYFDKISEYWAASEAAEAGRRVAQRLGDERAEAQSLNLLALAAWRRFDYITVKKWANEALDVLRVVGDPADRIVSLLHLGRASYRLGQYDIALDYIQAAQNLASYTDSRDSDALAELILGWIYQRLGDYDLAEEHFLATLRKRRLIGDRYGEATALSHLGWLAWDQRKFQMGLDYCQQALDISRTIGDRENEAYALSGMGFNYEGLNNHNSAISNYQEALAIQREIGATTLAIFDQAGLARIALAQQNFEGARQHIKAVSEWISAGRAQQFWDPWIIYQSAYEVLMALGETDAADAILDEAHTVLHYRAKEISNQELRLCFLKKVAVNREIEQAWLKRHDAAPASE